MSKSYSFYVHGDPKGQPRPRAFARRFGDKWQARVYDASTAEGWKSLIATAAQVAGVQKLEGPVKVSLAFTFARPKKHFLKSGLRENAPVWHVQKPDCDNLEKAVFDALTVLQVWNDDAQIADVRTTKHWATAGGCAVTISELTT